MVLDEMKKRVADVVGTARAKGADTAEATLTSSAEFSTAVRNGRIERITDSHSSRLVLSVSRDKRSASVTSTDLSPASVEHLVTDAVELAGIMDRDEYFGLPDPADLGRAPGDLALFDNAAVSMPTDRKIAMAMALEEEAHRIDGRIITDESGFACGVESIAFANSLGFCDGYRRTLNSIELACAVEDEAEGGDNSGKKQSAYWYSMATHLAGLEPIEEVASHAVQRTIRKLGAVKPRTCEVPVVFDPLTALEFVGWIAKAADGGSVFRKSSFLVGRAGERVGSPLLTIVDDPFLPGGLGSRPFDAEGVLSRRTAVIEGGILSSYLLSTYEARKLGLKTTGNAGGFSNLSMAPGTASPEEIIASVGEGLYVTNLFGPGANWSTGDYSQGAQGMWIKNGKLSHPVNEFTVAGTFSQMLEGIVMVGNDLAWRRPLAAPTFMIERMTISGT